MAPDDFKMGEIAAKVDAVFLLLTEMKRQADERHRDQEATNHDYEQRLRVLERVNWKRLGVGVALCTGVSLLEAGAAVAAIAIH